MPPRLIYRDASTFYRHPKSQLTTTKFSTNSMLAGVGMEAAMVPVFTSRFSKRFIVGHLVIGIDDEGLYEILDYFAVGFGACRMWRFI